jgi:hypothetical protein
MASIQSPRVERYGASLRALPSGLSEWAVHPGLGNEESRALEPDTWQTRRADYEFVTSQHANDIIGGRRDPPDQLPGAAAVLARRRQVEPRHAVAGGYSRRDRASVAEQAVVSGSAAQHVVAAASADDVIARAAD